MTMLSAEDQRRLEAMEMERQAEMERIVALVPKRTVALSVWGNGEAHWGKDEATGQEWHCLPAETYSVMLTDDVETVAWELCALAELPGMGLDVVARLRVLHRALSREICGLPMWEDGKNDRPNPPRPPSPFRAREK